MHTITILNKMIVSKIYLGCLWYRNQECMYNIEILSDKHNIHECKHLNLHSKLDYLKLEDNIALFPGIV